MFRSTGRRRGKLTCRTIGQGTGWAFTGLSKSITKHETVEVLGVPPNGILVRSADGRESNISSRRAGSFDVMEPTATEVSCGDRLLRTANRRDARLWLSNSVLVSVSSVDARG